MDLTQSDDAAGTAFRALRDGDSAEYSEIRGSSARPDNETPDGETLVASGDDLVGDLRQQAQALIDDADKLAMSWLKEAEAVREEALRHRRDAEAEVAAAREQAQQERDAVLVEAEVFREEALRLRRDAEAEVAAAREQAQQERDALQEVREQTREEAARILQGARTAAADILREATEEGRFTARTEADELLKETRQISDDIVQRATAGAERIIADAHREETMVLLDARARVDEVRGRLIRLYQEMEAATAARWGPKGSMAVGELAQGSHAGIRTENPQERSV